MSKKIIAIMLTIVMAVAVVATASACTGEPDKIALKTDIVEPSEEVEVSVDSTPFEVVQMEEVKMQLLFGASSVDTSAKTASQTLIATISPSSAENQNVDWEIHWTDSTKTENISDYLTITPQSDGALKATLTCKKSFRSVGTATVQVTARDGGAYALSVVTFVGNPDSVSIDTSAFSTAMRGTKEVYMLNSNSSYDIPIEITNVFNDVRDDVDITSFTVSGSGSIKLCQYSTSTGWDTATCVEQVMTADFSSNFYSATYSNGLIHIVTKNCVENYSKYVKGNAGVSISNRFYADVTATNGSLASLGVGFSVAGKVYSFNFWIYTAVDSVSLDSTSYEF